MCISQGILADALKISNQEIIGYYYWVCPLDELLFVSQIHRGVTMRVCRPNVPNPYMMLEGVWL